MRDKVVPIRSVLIFGGAGFIGSNWAHRLLKTTDAKVHIFDNLSRRGVHHNLKWLQKAAGSDRLQVTIGDVRDSAAVERAVSKTSEIYHFAAQVAVTTSVGVCSAIGDEIEFSPMFEAADRALYEAKRSGRNRVAYMPALHSERALLAADAVPLGA